MLITKPHVALLASPGMGHLIPVLELGERLVAQHGLHATVIVVATDTFTSQSLLDSTQPNLDILTLPVLDISGLVDPSASIITKLAVLMRQFLPILRSTISGMKFRPTVLVVDIFGTEALAIAEEFDMLRYVFVTSNAWFLAVTTYFPTIDKEVENEHICEKQPLKIPGCKSVRFDDTFEPYLNRNDQVYVEFKRLGMEIPTADGILVNTWEDLEANTLAALRNNNTLGHVSKVPTYPIGPLVRKVKSGTKREQVLDWLDMQPTESVLYVSFGSGGTLSAQQMIELAWGLELTQHRFIWVIRPPTNNDASAAFFSIAEYGSNSIERFLPSKFLERTHKVGLVVPNWAPQAQILAHPSVGGFLTHCGWNSTLESITNGVPMIACPLYAEQKLNATLLVEEVNIAVKLALSPSENVLGREEIKTVVCKIMDGKEGIEIRKRVKKLKSNGQKALSENGSSHESLTQVTKECEIHLRDVKAKAHGA